MAFPRSLGTLAALALGALAVPSGGAAANPDAGVPVAPWETIARVKPGTINVHLEPGPASPVMSRIRRISLRTGEPVGFLVTGTTTAPDGVPWHQVLLPGRPNGITGWVAGPLVKLERAGNRITISLSQRTLVLWRGGRARVTTRVVIGKSSTPTPLGTFAVWDNVHITSGIYSPAVLPLTSHSEVLQSFDGAEPRVAIHGMSGGLRAPVGSAVSNGCIRVPTRAMRAIAAFAVTGTPVEITA